MKIFTQDPEKYLSSSTREDSRLGMRAQSLAPEDLEKRSHGIVILGLADDTGVKNVGGRVGAALGPQAVRAKLYKCHVHILSVPLYDLGDLLPEADIAATHARAQELIERIHAAGHFPLILGGGHDLAAPEALALLAAYPRSNPGFLNLDAHLDLRDTSRGITSGSPWYLVSESPMFSRQKAELVEFGVQEQCNSSQLIAYAKAKKIRVHWLAEMRQKHGFLLKKFHLELQRLTRRKVVQLSLDIDGVRSAEAPGCSAPQVRGFSAEEVVAMAAAAGGNKAVKSFGIYELSPPLDSEGRTTALVAQCIISFLQSYSGKGKKGNLKVKSSLR